MDDPSLRKAMIRLATAFTQDYARAVPYVESLWLHCNIPFQLLTIPTDMPGYGMPGSIVQAGFFLDHIPPCRIIVFTDADLIMHRPLENDELAFLSSLKPGQISACYNKHPEQRFAEEEKMLYARGTIPGYEDVRVFNTGFVAAPVETYRSVFEKFKELWPVFDATYEHYAKIQLALCTAVHLLGFEWVPTPSHICAHGHFAAAEGIDCHARPPKHNGRVICFDHRISH